MKCPCENCICLPVCRHKRFCLLFEECTIIRNYIPHYQWVCEDRKEKLSILKEILKPTNWYIKKNKNLVYIKEGNYYHLNDANMTPV